MNHESSLNDVSLQDFSNFISKLYTLYNSHRQLISIREFENLESLIIKEGISQPSNQQTMPYRILSVNSKGDFSTFSPELIDIDAGIYQSF